MCVCVCVFVWWWWWWWCGGGGGGVGGSEFSDSWGKRGEGGQGREGFSFLTAWWMKPSFSLFVLAWRLLSLLPDGSKTEEVVCRVGGITWNAEGFAGETGVVNVLEEGERDTNDLLSCSHYPSKGLAAGRVQAPYHTVMQLVRMLSMVPL